MYKNKLSNLFLKNFYLLSLYDYYYSILYIELNLFKQALIKLNIILS